PIFFSSAPRTTHSSPLSLHDALPISGAFPRSTMLRVLARTARPESDGRQVWPTRWFLPTTTMPLRDTEKRARSVSGLTPKQTGRSEEHTSELQSRFDLVCRLLLEKKK